MDTSKIGLFGHLKRALFGAPEPSDEPVEAQDTVPVGTGAENERMITLDGVPHLFRDEGKFVAHFVAKFATEMRETPFGTKLLPSLVPHWALSDTLLGDTLAEAIGKVLQRVSKPEQSSSEQMNLRASETEDSRATRSASHGRPASGSMSTESGSEHRQSSVDGGRERSRRVVAYKGTILEWGVRKFPDRKDQKKTYENFALVLRTDNGEQVLQGEGLRDALAEAKSNLGDRVNVRRLHQVDVPAIDNEGRAILDAQGNQKIWKKWIWAIKRI